jgi:hypothetical protein
MALSGGSAWTATRSEHPTEAVALRCQMSMPERAEKADSGHCQGLDMVSVGVVLSI